MGTDDDQYTEMMVIVSVDQKAGAEATPPPKRQRIGDDVALKEQGNTTNNAKAVNGLIPRTEDRGPETTATAFKSSTRAGGEQVQNMAQIGPHTENGVSPPHTSSFVRVASLKTGPPNLNPVPILPLQLGCALNAGSKRLMPSSVSSVELRAAQATDPQQNALSAILNSSGANILKKRGKKDPKQQTLPLVLLTMVPGTGNAAWTESPQSTQPPALQLIKGLLLVPALPPARAIPGLVTPRPLRIIYPSVKSPLVVPSFVPGG